MKQPTLKERTVVVIKPDGVKRGLIGQIIARFEKAGLKIVALKLVQPTKEHYELHYPSTKEWFRKVGEKTLGTYKKYGLNPKKELGTTDKVKIGQLVKKWTVDFMATGPVVAMIVQGPHAIDNVRMIVGPTLPVFAPPGTIRGDFSGDSPALANSAKRPVKNLIHASGDAKDAEKEIKLWFAPEEIHEYKRVEEEIMF
jgi:nucleoside-diphosphate kinase